MIQVINRAIDIIEYVAKDEEQPKQMGHIANELKLNTATCSNIVKTLVNRGFLKKAHKQKGYVLGTGLMEILNGSFVYKDLLAAADIEMEKVVKVLNENCLIATLKENKRIVIHKKNSFGLIQAITPDEKDAYDSSTGRLLVAMLSDKDLDLYVKRYGLPSQAVWPEADSRLKFLQQIQLIRNTGYVLIEDTVQIVGIAAPIYRAGKVIASFSIYMPSFRFNEDIRDKIIKTSVEVAKRLSVL